MPAGTWNLGRLRKQVNYVGIKDLGIGILDPTNTSELVFNIIDFPTVLTAGKNLFKIKASTDVLVKNSKIHIEVLDSNGNPIYYEPINYLEADGTRVIAIYIYPDTPYGTATVYIAGRAKVNPMDASTGNNSGNLRYSQDVNDPDYLNYPNILWRKTVTVAPERYNTSEIIFTKAPKMVVQEVVQPYLEITNLQNVATQSRSGNLTYTIKPKLVSGAALGTSTTTNAAVIGLPDAAQVSMQGQFSMNTPPSQYGQIFNLNPVSVAISRGGSAGSGVAGAVATGVLTPEGPVRGGVISNAVPFQVIQTVSVFETSQPFFTTDMNIGDILTIHEPLIDVPKFTVGNTQTPSRVIPSAQLQSPVSTVLEVNTAFPPNLAQDDSGLLPGGLTPLSGSYRLFITNILNNKKAEVAYLDGFRETAFQNSNTAGKFAVQVREYIPQYCMTQFDPANPSSPIIDNVQPTTNFTCSYTLPFVTTETPQSQSFAEVTLSDIEPATGDVYKVKTFYKAGGQFGEYIDAGETILEQVEMLTDSGSQEANGFDGASYNRMGFFSSLGDYETYFTSSGGPLTPTNLITPSFDIGELMSGITLTPASTSNVSTISYVRLRDEYRPNLTKNSEYLLSLNSYAVLPSSAVNSQTNLPDQPIMDIFISGSYGSIVPDMDESYGGSRNSYIFSNSEVVGDYNDTLELHYEDNKEFGIRVGTIVPNISGSVSPSLFRFKSTTDQQVEFFLVPRQGVFTVSNISIKTFNETGFTPNFGKFATRMPSQYTKIPLSFKFQFFDQEGKKTEYEPVIYPIFFTGENTVVAENDAVISGTVTIGQVQGQGMELAGVASAYLRTIGYEGFKSASRTDRPGGFLMYTGSVLPETPDDYKGTGFEIVEHSESYFRFSTGTDPGLEIRTPNFFFGDNNTQISGSNGNIKISGSNLQMLADSFYLGGASNYVSGGNGNIEISSSDFHLNAQGQVVMQGTITAEAGGTIGGWSISTNELTSANNKLVLSAVAPYYISSSDFQVDDRGAITASAGNVGGWTINSDHLVDSSNQLKLEPAGTYTISSSNFQVDAEGSVTASKGIIGGFVIGTNTLTADNFTIDPSGKSISLGTGTDIFVVDADVGLQLGNGTFADAPFSVTKGGILKATSGTIGGWTLASTTLTAANMTLNSNGTIESNNFASNTPGSGFRLTADQGGFLEVENARIRGTLSTAVFEKEAVNAVGGQLYIANSTAMTGSALALLGVHTATQTTMSFENVSGFVAGEILSAKKISSTGFATEYFKVESSSRFDPGSENNFSGYLYVIRGYSGSAPQASGSLGDLASNAQTYSGSQVIVSTGRYISGTGKNTTGTGYVRINANPSDPYTPYIDIVERTGSAIYDVDLKVRLGDLSGLSQARLHGRAPASAGFGLYAQNVFLEGGIVAKTGSIAGIEMQSGKLFTGVGTHGNTNTGFYIDSASKFALGDKLTWDGSNLVVKGQIQLVDGSNVGNGMQWSGSWTSGDHYQLNDGVEHSGSSYIAQGSGSHVASATNQPPNEASWSLMAGTGSDGVLGADGAAAKSLSINVNSNVYAFANAADTTSTPTAIEFVISAQNLSSDVDTNSIVIKDADGSTISNPSLSSSLNSGTGVVTGSISFASTLSGDKDKLPISITVTEDGLSDVTTLHKVQGGTAGNNGADAKLISLESSTLVFVKALDGTITPATASLTASLQNMSPATASWTTTPSVTLNSGSLLDLSRMYLTKGHFGTNTSVKVTAASGSGHSDSMTFVLLDEGSGNVQAILGNSSHTVPASADGNDEVFTGGGTTLNVYEGVTELTYDSGSQSAGQFSASLQNVNITPGIFTGNETTTATLSVPTAMSQNNGAIHFEIVGFTQNNTAFTSSLTQSFAKSIAGVIGGSGSVAKSVNINATTLVFAKAQDGTITPSSASFTASLNNPTDDGAWTNNLGSIISKDNTFDGPATCIVTKDNFIDGMSVTYTMAAADNLFADTVTLKLLDVGSGNVQSVLGNSNHTFPASLDGTVSNFVGGGTILNVYEGATPLTYESTVGDLSAGEFSASISGINVTPGSFTGDSTTAAVLSIPTAMSETSGAIHITVHGFTQNNTAFTSSVTQSFAKSLQGIVGDTGNDGATAKTIIVTPDAYFFVKAQDGTITPSSITISGSGQNLTNNGTWNSNEATLTDPITVANNNSIKITSANFVDGMLVTFTTHADDDEIVDAVTIKELDAGSGNVQTIISNQAHTFQANHTGSISNFNGDTSIYVFEGASKIPFTASFASSSLGLTSSIYTNQALPLNWRHAPSGSTMQMSSYPNFSDNLSDNGTAAENAIDFGEGPFGEQELIWECYPDHASNDDGGWNSSTFAIDSGSSYMYVVYAKRHYHQQSGSFYWGWRNISANGGTIMYGSSNGSVTTSGNPYFMHGDKQPILDRWYMHIGIIEPSASVGQTGGNHPLGGTYDLVTNTKISDATSFRFTSGSTKARHRSYHYYNTVTGSDGVAGGGSAPAAYSTKMQSMALPAVYKMTGTEPSLEMLLAGHRISNDTELGKRVDVRVTGLNTAAAQLTVKTTGSTQNGTTFDQQSNIISYNKSTAGSEPITVVQTNESHTFVGNAAGVIQSYVGSGTKISVFEGATQLQGKDNVTPGPGEFVVARVGDNITPGGDTINGLDVVIADHSSGTETSGSVTFTITGKSVGGTDFSRTKKQTFAVSKQGIQGVDGAEGNDGSDGVSARAVNITMLSQSFSYNTDGGLPFPATSLVTATAVNTTGTVKYQFFVNDASVQALGTGNTYTYTPQVSSSLMPDKLEVQITDDGQDGTIKARDMITAQGLKAGSEAIIINLSNEAHTLPTTNTAASDGTSGVTYTGSGTDITVYLGTTQLNYGSGTSGFEVSVSENSITAGTVSTVSSNIRRFGDAEACSAVAASLVFTITVTDSSGVESVFEKLQSFAKSIGGDAGTNGTNGSNGSNGTDARAVNITMLSQSFSYNTDGGQAFPATSLVTATAANTTGTVYYDFLLNDVSAQNTTGTTYTYTPQVSSSLMPDKLEVQIREGGSSGTVKARDMITAQGLRDGGGAITVQLSNEAHTMPVTAGGTVTYDNSGTDITAFIGSTQLDYGSGNNQFEVSAGGASNVTAGNASTVSSNIRRFAVVSNFNTSGTVSAQIAFTITVTDSSGVVSTFTKIQSFAKSQQGSAGNAGSDGNDGSNGISARAVNITMLSQSFSYNTTDIVPFPATSLVTATAANTTGTVKYQFFVNDVSVQAMGTTATYTYTPQVSSSLMPDKLEVQISDDGDDGTIKARDMITATGMRESSQAVTIQLTNEAHTLPTTNTAAANGTSGVTYTTSGTDINVWRGTTRIPYGSGTNGFEVAASGTNIDVATGGNVTTVSTYTRRFGDASGASANISHIEFTITVTDAAGIAQAFTKIQSFAKSIQGGDGTNGNNGTNGTNGNNGADGAVGATGPNFGFLSGSLGSIDTSDGGGLPAGLILTGGVFGFHNDIAQNASVTLNDFTSFLDDEGNFYLGSGSGDLGAGYFAWNNTNKSLLISGSGVDIRVPTFFLGDNNSTFISGSLGNIEISSSKFHLQSDGDIITNDITASGILINGDSLITGAVTASGITIEGGSTFRGRVDVTNRDDFSISEDTLPFGMNGTWKTNDSGEVFGWTAAFSTVLPNGGHGKYTSGSNITTQSDISLQPFSGSNTSAVLQFNLDQLNEDGGSESDEQWIYQKGYFEVDTSHTYKLTARHKLLTGSISQDFHVGFVSLDENFKSISGNPSSHSWPIQGDVSRNNWHIYEGLQTGTGTSHGNWKVGTKYGRVVFIAGHNGTYPGIHQIDYIYLENLTTGESSIIDRTADNGIKAILNSSVPPGTSANPGEMLLHGNKLYESSYNSLVSASIYYKGGIYSLPLKENMITGRDQAIISTSGSFKEDQGYIVFDTRGANEAYNQYGDRDDHDGSNSNFHGIGFNTYNGGGGHPNNRMTSSVALAKIRIANGTESIWTFDNNDSGFIDFTPNINHCVIGTYDSDIVNSLTNAQLFYTAVSIAANSGTFTSSLMQGTTAWANSTGGGYTSIDGNSITTGNIKSANFDENAGSKIDLYTGTITLGGSTNPNFKVDEKGLVSAANFREKLVGVDDSNSGSYLRNISGTGTDTKYNLVFDGSLGGAIASNMEISVTRAFIIADVELPITGSDKSNVDVYINVTGMRFDDGVIAQNYNANFEQALLGESP